MPFFYNEIYLLARVDQSSWADDTFLQGNVLISSSRSFTMWNHEYSQVVEIKLIIEIRKLEPLPLANYLKVHARTSA